MKSIDERIKNLPPALKKEVEEFVNSLLKKRRKKNGKKLRQDWAGAAGRRRGLTARTEAVPRVMGSRLVSCISISGSRTEETGSGVCSQSVMADEGT